MPTRTSAPKANLGITMSASIKTLAELVATDERCSLSSLIEKAVWNYIKKRMAPPELERRIKLFMRRGAASQSSRPAKVRPRALPAEADGTKVNMGITMSRLIKALAEPVEAAEHRDFSNLVEHATWSHIKSRVPPVGLEPVIRLIAEAEDSKKLRIGSRPNAKAAKKSAPKKKIVRNRKSA